MQLQFHLIGQVAFEDWDHRWAETGIGGSETSQIRMAEFLAAAGHEVHSYAPIPPDCPREWRGTHWHRTEEFDYNASGVIVIYRSPELIDRFEAGRDDRIFWLVCQDWNYATLTPQRLARFSRIVVLCHSHRKFMEVECDNPELAKKLWVTRNCASTELWQRIEAEGMPERHPFRLMYASSPDRGLKSSLQVFDRVKQMLPQAELVCTYGYNNLDKLIKQGLASSHRSTVQRAKDMLKEKQECVELLRSTGAQFLGRVSQTQLYREWAKTTALIYITDFFETGWCTGWDAQAMGAIPVYSPIYAQGEHTRFGVQVRGHPKDLNTIAEAATAVEKLLTNPELQQSIRGPMMEYARNYWCWEHYVQETPNESWIPAAEEDFAKLKARVSCGLAPGTFRLPEGLADDDDEALARSQYLKLQPGDVMLDVGAADGSWTIAAALQGATVYAIDPLVDYTHLSRLVDEYNVCDLVTLVPMTVSHVANGLDHVIYHNEKLTIPVMTLDAWSMQMHLERIDFIKIDVEGHELDVLRGCYGVLCKWHPRVFVEIHDETVPGRSVTLKQVQDYFDRADLGYRTEATPLEYQGKLYHHFFAEDVPLAAPGVPISEGAAADLIRLFTG